MKTLKQILISISPIIFYLIFSVLSNGNHKWVLPSMSLVYFLIGMYSKNTKQLYQISLPFLILIAFTLFLKNALIGIILFYLIILIVSLLFGRFIRYKSVWYVSIYMVFIALIFNYGLTNWLSFIRNFYAHSNKKSPSIELLTSTNKDIKLDTIKNKVIVLDFWTTSCGECFKKFPEFEKFYLEFKSNPNIKIYSVNIPIDRDTILKTKKLVEKLGYKFPTLYAKSNLITKELGFNLFPHLIILKNGVIRYNGKLILEKKTKIHNLRTEIKPLIK
jgi:thiol-disulfide isomerase/thioredoxin